MTKLSNIIPVSDLRQDAANLLKKLNKTTIRLLLRKEGEQQP